MLFERPLALLLLLGAPLIGAFLWRGRAFFDTRLHRFGVMATGTLAWCLLVAALAGPWLGAERGRPTRIVIAAGSDDGMARSWRDATPARDPFRVVAPGARLAIGPLGSTELPATAGDPDLGTSLRTAVSLAADGGDVLFAGTAGDSGRDLCDAAVESLATELRAAGVRVHARTTRLVHDTVALLTVDHPARIGRGEAFRLTAEVDAPREVGARIEVHSTDDDAVLGAREFALRVGTTHVVLDVAPGTRRGPLTLETRVIVDGTVASRERSAVLCDGVVNAVWLGESSSQLDALRSTLAPHGIDVTAADPAAPLAADVLIVDDLPASAWPDATQTAVADAVPAQGLGLLMAGAWRNLGPGGYANSPLAALIPVEMPQREERRDPSCSLVVVIDTSGSMGARIDLAKEVARLAIRRLMPHDKAGIVEFYGSKRWAAPLQPASNLIELMRALDRMQAGGGTVIYSALEESFYALLNARTRFKHVLVLTDGGVESGPFEDLARRMADANMQLSTVLIGPQAQSEFLMNLAQWGGGRFYACPSRFLLPDLRFKEPQTTRLPAVREEPISAHSEAGRESTQAFAGDDRIEFGGIVEAALKPGAERLVEADGGASVLAAWDQGAGRVAALATELLGPMTDPVRGPRWSAFLADQVRSLARGSQAARPRLDVEATRGRLRVVLHAVDVDAAPVLTVQSATASVDVDLLPTAGGVFEAAIAWPDDGVCELAVNQLGAMAVALRPLPRTGRLHDRHDTLARLARASGGTRDGPLPTDPPPALHEGRIAITPHLAIAGLLAFLLLLIARRWPRGVTRVVAPLLLAVLLVPTVAAQDGDPITERIAAELRTVGDLDALVAEWRDGTEAQRLALARARGDLAAIIELTADATDRETLVTRVVALDATGQLPAAIELLDRLLADPDTSAAEQLALGLHRAELLAAAGRRDAARTAFREVARTAEPELRRAIGHLAGGIGLRDVALELHVAPDPRADDEELKPAALSFIHLRRAAWLEADGDSEGALREYRNAAATAALERERAFALSRALGLMQGEAELRAFVAATLARLDDATTAEIEALLDALRALGDGDAALSLLARGPVLERPALQEEIVAIAVECGRAEGAIEEARRLLATRAHDHRLRIALALLLTDLLRKDDARAVLLEGIAGADHRELLALTSAAAELFDDAAFAAGIERLRSDSDESVQVDGLMAEVDALRARHRDGEAATLALAALDRYQARDSRARLAAVLESLGRTEETIGLLRSIHAEKASEDVALRLAWLLSRSKDEAQRKESQQLFRDVWLSAGSAARRTQAQERVLDGAAREGTLADLVIELEDELARPDTPQREAKREALVKIWTRAQDTFGARDVLLGWVKEEPGHEVDAWQAIAQVCLETDDYRGQERALRHLMDIDPQGEIEYRQQLVLAFLERGRAGDARAVIREMLDRETLADPVTFEFSAGIYALAGRPREAARLYRRAYAVHPDRIETLLLWANAMVAQQRGGEAIGVFVDLLVQDVPDDLFLVAVDGLLNLAAPAEALGFAERALRRRIAARPDRVFLQRALQDVLEQLGDKSGRLAVLEETVLIAGQQRSAWLREAMDEAAQVKDWPHYLGHARSLLRTGEEVPPTVFVEMGEALLAAGDLPGAERAFARARLAPDFAAIERRIAKAFETARRLDDAERILRRALRRAPDDPEARFAVARLCELRGSREEALSLWLDGAVELVRNEVFASAEAPARGFSRNRRDDGPGVDEAIGGVMRTADRAEQVAPLRAALFDRTDGREPLEAAATRTLATRLWKLAGAFGDDAARERARALEDSLLGDEKLDDRIRRQLVTESVQRLEVDRLLALPDKVFFKLRDQQIRLLLLAGRDEDAVIRSQGLEPQSLETPLRWLTLLGAIEERDELATTLREAATKDPRTAGRTWSRVASLFGESGDERAIHDADLAEALAVTGTAKARAQKLLSALRAHTELEPELRSTHARTLVALVTEAADPTLAWSVLESGRDWLPTGELAALVPLSLKDLSSPYLLASRMKHLDLLPIDEAERVLREVTRPLGEEARTPLLQGLSNGVITGELAARVMKTMRLSSRAPSDNTWLTRLVTGTEHGREILDGLARLMLRDIPDDPRRLLLDLRLAADTAARSSAQDELARSLADADPVDWTWLELVDATLDASTRAERQVRLEALRQNPTPGPAALLLRGLLAASLGQIAAAGDDVTAAALAMPENLSVQNRATSMLALAGREDDAIAVYRTWIDHAAQIYPHQTLQLARALTDRGDPAGALALLDRADDPYGMTSRERLRAAMRLSDADARARELRRWLQTTQKADNSVRIVISRSFGDTRRVRIADVLAAPQRTTHAERTDSDIDGEGELLATTPEGLAVLHQLLRRMDASSRFAATPHYRGLVRAALAGGSAAELVRDAEARLTANPWDSDASGILWAAAQLGLDVTDSAFAREYRQRALLADRDVARLADLCWTALARNRLADVDRILGILVADRRSAATLRGYDDGETGALLRLLAERLPQRLAALAPQGDAVDADLDAWLLILALESDAAVDSVAEQFAAIGEKLRDPAQPYQPLQLALPWAGLALQRGDLDLALQCYGANDSALERTDTFAPDHLAAAVPPLERWGGIARANELGERLLAAIADATRLEHRFMLLRIAGLLAHRMDQADATDAATALRARLTPLTDGIPAAAEWLVPPR